MKICNALWEMYLTEPIEQHIYIINEGMKEAPSYQFCNIHAYIGRATNIFNPPWDITNSFQFFYKENYYEGSESYFIVYMVLLQWLIKLLKLSL